MSNLLSPYQEVGLVWCLPEEHEFLPHQQPLKPTTAHHDEPETQKGLPAPTNAPYPPVILSEEQPFPPPAHINPTGESRPSDLDSHSVVDSDHETTSYWHGTAPLSVDNRVADLLTFREEDLSPREPGLFDIHQWLDAVVDGLVACTIDDNQGGPQRDIQLDGPHQAQGESSLSKPTPKRVHDETNRSGNESNSSGHVQRPKRQRAVDEPSSRFACPFFKRNPLRYMESRTCAGPGWTTTHRVKEHLYRRHMLPRFSCPRCHTTFTSNQLLTAHLKATTSCDVHEGEPLEGIGPEVERQLRKRNRLKTEETKWLHMYQLLFPDDDAASYPTPYYEYANEGLSRDLPVNTPLYDEQTDLILEYEDFLCGDLPPEFQANLETEVEERLGNCSTETKQLVVELARDTQLRLFQYFLGGRERRDDDCHGKIAHSPPTTPSAAAAPSINDELVTYPDAPALEFFPETNLGDIEWVYDPHLMGVFDFGISLAEDDGALLDQNNITNEAHVPSSNHTQAAAPIDASFASKEFASERPRAIAEPVTEPSSQVLPPQHEGNSQQDEKVSILEVRRPEQPEQSEERRRRNAGAAARFRQRKREREQEAQRLLKEKIDTLEAENHGLQKRLAELTGVVPLTASPPSWPPPVKLPHSTHPTEGYESAGYASSRASSIGSISSSFAGKGGRTVKSFPCTFPGCTSGPFSTRFLLDSHAVVHTEECPFHCPDSTCPRGKAGLGFKRLGDMIRHQIQVSHPRTQDYSCPFCPRRFVKLDLAQRHISRQHPDRPVQSPIVVDLTDQDTQFAPFLPEGSYSERGWAIAVGAQRSVR